jgi:uncharacterized protein (UPF0335 family)
MTMKSEVTGKLKSYLERVELLEEERKSLGDDVRLVYAEAKAEGFDPKTIRTMVKRRRKDVGELAEEDALLETYMHAVGMLPENPLASAVKAMASDAMARDEVIEAFQLMLPLNGEVIAKVGGAPMRLWRGEDGIARSEEYIEPKSSPTERIGKHAGKSATVLTMVKSDPVKAKADAAEARSRIRQALDEPADPEDSSA